MAEVTFYDSAEDALLKFAVIIARTDGKWIFCKHRERDTYEVPGGHREKGEDILSAAKRELMEETGAVDFTIKPICVYSVKGKTRASEGADDETFGMLIVNMPFRRQILCRSSDTVGIEPRMEFHATGMGLFYHKLQWIPLWPRGLPRLAREVPAPRFNIRLIEGIGLRAHLEYHHIAPCMTQLVKKRAQVNLVVKCRLP